MSKRLPPVFQPNDKVGRWTIIKETLSIPRSRRYICRCACGTTRITEERYLKRGESQSCGCQAIERAAATNRKHMLSFSSEHRIWTSMKSRCNNPNDRAYPSYGGRGIRVCERWQKSFQDFLADVGKRPSNSYSLNRINNNGNYEPRNVEWATIETQLNNRRGNVLVTYKTTTKTLAEWSKETGIKYPTLKNRLTHGWSVDDALTLKPSHAHSPYRTKRKIQRTLTKRT